MNNNSKRILCHNILNNRVCNYKNKCMYAHKLSEQRIDPIRHKVYTILKNDYTLDNINLASDKKLLDSFIQLTKVCYYCLKGECPGGYNCRNGAVNNKYRICYDDLMYGNCRRFNCNSIHLTKRGLIPHYYQLSKKKYNKNQKNKYNDKYDKYDNNDKYNRKSDNSKDGNSKDNSLSDSTSTSPVKDIKMDHSTQYTSGKTKKFKRNLNNIEGVLLTEKFLLNNFRKTNDNSDDSSDLDESEEKIKEMIEYLNNNSDDDSYEESIFIE